MYKNAEARRAAKSRKKASDPDYYKKLDAANYQRRKERKKAIVRDYRMRHPEKIAALSKRYYAENQEAILEKSRIYRQSQEVKERAKAYRRKWEFGVSKEEYEEMLVAQGGKCAICFRHHSEFKTNLAVDHCHKTGVIRALLCTRCNPMLGYAMDNPETLRNAAAYIEFHNTL